ncbi:MAG: hypothetical protein CVV49_07120 [Spirochaetae bacterium HGW-Spirochaetae-5]|nr:MAG: hypothetical protein CVV49_07120 [Spirochaetae bacterium HGW-Spirochaetae-5]
MKKKIIILALIIFAGTIFDGFAEIVYMNDGQIIKGDVLREDDLSITVKTKYQTQNIKKKHIARIMYGDRDLEEVNILKIDGSIIEGYLVDQDNKQVIIRKEKTSKNEIIIKKSDIKQMSSKSIIPLQTGMSFKVGVFNPLSSKGANFQSSLIFLGSIGLNLTFIKNTRIFIEGGFTKLDSDSGVDVYMQVIPITLNLNYNFNISNFYIIPRVGAGLSMIEFNDGLNQPTQGYDFTAIGGVGLEYEIIERTLRFGVFSDFVHLREKNATLNNVMGGVVISYLF